VPQAPAAASASAAAAAKQLRHTHRRTAVPLYCLQDIVGNFVHLMATYGHIPNGIRTYYINRSQPPLFSEMARIVYEATANRTLLRWVAGWVWGLSSWACAASALKGCCAALVAKVPLSVVAGEHDMAVVSPRGAGCGSYVAPAAVQRGAAGSAARARVLDLLPQAGKWGSLQPALQWPMACAALPACLHRPFRWLQL
jgi:hypothetical protein